MNINTLIVSDALDFLQSLPDASIPLHVFSPPYNLGTSSGAGMRQYGHYSATAAMRDRGGSGAWKNAALADGYGDFDDAMPWPAYTAWQQAILRECWRTLPDNGAIYYVHKPRIQGGICRTPLDYNPGLPVRQIVIWARAGGFNWNPTYYCPTHEWIVILAKPAFRLINRGVAAGGDVWSIPQEAGTWHPAPFPLELADRIIETTMPALVCDVFAGSGTTARAAKRHGVDFTGCDRNPAYVARALAAIAREPRLTHRQQTIDTMQATQEALL